MKIAILAPILLASFAMAFSQAVQANDNGKFSLETGMHYNTGKYGGTQSTDILYIPVTGRYRTGLWAFRLTVPYLQVTGPGNVLNGVGAVGAATTASSSRSGLGDVIAAATRTVYNDARSGFMVNLAGKIKLGTADSTKGLGTGQNDYAFQSEVFHITKPLTSFGILGYKIYGQPATYTLKNGFYGLVGGRYKFNEEENGGAILSYSQKTTVNGSAHLTAILFADHKIGNTWKVQGYVLKGFTKSVPSAGIGLTIGYNF